MNQIVLTIHILGAGFLLAVFTFAVIFLFRKPFTKERLANLRTIINVGAGAFIYQIITGSLLFSERPQDFKANVLFWVKIGLFVLDLIIGLILVNRKLKAMQKSEGGKILSPQTLAAWIVANLLLTIVIIVVSVMIVK